MKLSKPFVWFWIVLASLVAAGSLVSVLFYQFAQGVQINNTYAQQEEFKSWAVFGVAGAVILGLVYYLRKQRSIK